MFGAVKQLFVGLLCIALLSFALAGPVCLAWDQGPRALGAPALGYFACAACLGLLGVLTLAGVLIVAFARACAATFVNEL